MKRLIDMLRATSGEGYAPCREAIADFDLRELPGAVDVPILVIAGEDRRGLQSVVHPEPGDVSRSHRP